MKTAQRWFAAGALFAGLGVAAGAFGAHALRERLVPDLLLVFETGVRYQVYHALAIMAVALAGDRWPAPGWHRGALLLLAGLTVFSGSLYTLALTGLRGFGAVTPVGGVLLLAGWATLAWTAWRTGGAHRG